MAIPDATHQLQPQICALPGSPLAAARHGIDACVHCGFCLQACPTYLALEDENDSPRGRILLMRALVEGELAPTDPAVNKHIDQCLGCRACETACPSGVPYGHLLEATRATLNSNRHQVGRLVLAVFSHRWLLRPALAMARVFRATGLPALLAKLPGNLGFAMGMLASTRPPIRRASYTPAPTESRGSAAMLEGCVMKSLFADTNAATARVLAHNGYAMRRASGQGCCGALHAHAGDLDAARKLARANVRSFEASGADVIAVNAAGCGAMMKEYGYLLADDPDYAERAARVSARVRDVSEVLAAAGPRRGAALPMVVTYDAPCHLLHAQRVVTPPLQVLGAIPELALVAHADADQCCGAAGIYNLIEPDISAKVLAPKVQRIAATGAALVGTGTPGCHMLIGAGLLRAGLARGEIHPVYLLDAW